MMSSIAHSGIAGPPYWLLDPTHLILFVAGIGVGLLLFVAVQRYRQRRPQTSVVPEAQLCPVAALYEVTRPEPDTEQPPVRFPPLVDYLQAPPAGPGFVADEVRVNPQIKSALLLLVQQAPAQAAMAARTTGQYVLSFTPETQALLSGGARDLMPAAGGGFRAIAQDSGRIVEHGRLDPIARLGRPAAFLAAWQVLSVVTAQKYLADISAHLERIELGVKGVQDWLEGDRKSKLTSAIGYIAQWAPTVDSIALREHDLYAISGQIEAIERDCLHVVDASLSQFRRAFEEFQRIPLTGVGLRKHYEAAAVLVNEGNRQVGVSLLASYARALAVRLRAALPLDRDLTRRRANDVLAQLERQQQLATELSQLVEKRVPELRGRLIRRPKERHFQERILIIRDENLRPLVETAQAARTSAAGLSTLISQDADAQDEALVLTVDCGPEGDISRVRAILPMSAQVA